MPLFDDRWLRWAREEEGRGGREGEGRPDLVRWVVASEQWEPISVDIYRLREPIAQNIGLDDTRPAFRLLVAALQSPKPPTGRGKGGGIVFGIVCGRKSPEPAIRFSSRLKHLPFPCDAAWSPLCPQGHVLLALKSAP